MVTRWISFILILLLTAGCEGTSMISDSESVQTLDGNNKTVIMFWHTYNDLETRLLMQELIPAFERTHPDTRIKCVNLANNNELKYSLIAQASSGRGPDIVRMDINWVPEFSHKGLLEPLSGFPGFQDVWHDFHEKAMRAGQYNGRYYSLPLNLYTKLTIFNRELLARFGYSEPPRTMNGILELARKEHLTIGLGGLDAWDTLPYLYSLGGSLMDRDYTRASGFLNSDRTVRAVEQLTELHKENLIHLSAVAMNRDNWAGVRNGSTLLTDEAPWFFSMLEEFDKRQALGQTISVPFPKGNGSSSIIGGENLVIIKGSRHPAEAWDFMKWMTGMEGQLIMAKAGLIPANREAVKAMHVPEDSYLYPYVEAVDDAFLQPPVKNWSKIEEVYTVYLHQIFLGNLSAREGLNRAAAEIDTLLDY